MPVKGRVPVLLPLDEELVSATAAAVLLPVVLAPWTSPWTCDFGSY
jgi:hypothetical protein